MKKVKLCRLMLFFLLFMCMQFLILPNVTGQDAEKDIKKEETKNFVKNGDFEEEELNYWKIGHRDTTIGTWSLDDKIFKTGKKSLKMYPKDSQTPRYLLLQQYHRDILPGRYLFEGWCMVSDDYNGIPFVAINVLVPVPGEIGKNENKYHTIRMPQDYPCNEWYKLTKEIDIPENAVIYIQIIVPGTRGAVWFDSFSLRSI